MKTKISIKLVSLIVSRTKTSKLYFYKSTHFFFFLSLSTVPIHQFHSYTKILTLIPLIPTPSSPHSHPYSSHSHPDSPHSHPDSPHSHHSQADSPHSHHSPHSVPRFPIPAFTDSQISTHVYVNNQTQNTKAYSINSTRSLKTRWHRVHTDKNKNKEHPN